MGERDLVPGDVLDKYRLERLLGRGGMGEVWAAHDPDLDRRIALKVLNRALAGDDDAQARLQREGRAMAKLRHPNVITVHDALFRAGRGLIAMELIDGESLATWLIRRRSVDEIMTVMLAAGRGLAAAHHAGMVHRDFKPHNVLVDRDGRVLVTDFGLARASGDTVPPAGGSWSGSGSGSEPEPEPDPKAVTPWAAVDAGAETVDRAQVETAATGISPPPGPAKSANVISGDLGTPLTQTGALLGTPAYMAPEQLAGRPADARADQFAFCVTAWEAFAGERPFRGKSVEELAAAVKAGAHERSDRVPRRLRPLLARGLVRDPAERWPTMDALLAALDRAWRRPRRIAIAAIATTVLAGVGVAVVLAAGHQPTVEGCGDADAALAPAWSPAIRADVAQRLAAVPDRDRVLRFFDRWGDSWKTARRANCQRTTEAEFAARRICLESIRDELALITELRTTARPDTFADQERYRFIPVPESCVRDPRALGPSPPPVDVRDDVVRLRGELADARVDLESPRIDSRSVDLTALAARAEATHYQPLIAEVALASGIREMMLPHDDDPASACAGLAAAIERAEAIGYERLVVEGLFVQAECTYWTGGDDGAIIRRLDAIVTRNGHPLERAAIDSKLADDAYVHGELDRAVTLIGQAHAGYAGYELSRWVGRTMLAEAKYRLDRGRDGDLAAATQLLAALPDDEAFDPEELARLRFRVAWWSQAKDLPPPPDDSREDMPANTVAITFTVVDGGAPVAGAQVGASYEPHVDATRVWMGESGIGAAGVTDASGNVTLTVGDNWMAYARKGDRAGWIAVPSKGAAATIALAPTGSLVGATSGIARGPDPDPADPTGVFIQRIQAVALLHVDLKSHIMTFEAPLDSSGHWHVDGLVPGEYLLSVQAKTFGNDTQARQAELTVAAGRADAPTFDFGRELDVLEVVSADRTDYVMAFDADRIPANWDQLGELLLTRAWITRAPFLDPTAADKLAPGHRIARLGVPRGLVACMLPSIMATGHTALSRFFATDTDPPHCALIVMRDRVTRWEPGAD